MAYSTTTDYTAQNATLKKQLEAEADAVKKAAIQAQIDANQSSKEQKIASDLTAYGKYANDTELNNAAGIMAQNQIGTGYETQKANLNTGYDNAKQNANNDALSRGMGRSSYSLDRMANLDVQRANALSGIEASKALAIQNARTNILGDYRANTANALANEKNEFANTIGAYSNDYQAEVNKIQGDNDASNDWKIPYLQAARNEKIAAQEAAALKAAATAKTYSGGGSRSGSSSGGTVDVVTGDTTQFNATTTDETSPYGVITDIDGLKSQGFTSAQIKANAKAAYEAGKITAAQYQMYVQYAGRD